ncbi:hypothetical protein ACPA9J_32600 [Pseudomonas aeruginosa]
MWCVQLLIFAYGMEMVRRYESFAGPVILLTVAALAAWMYLRAGASIAWSSGEPQSGSQMWLKIFGGAAFLGDPVRHHDPELLRLRPAARTGAPSASATLGRR